MSQAIGRSCGASLGGLLTAVFMGSCALGQDSGAALEGFTPVQALQIVDCQLPGQVRAVGGRTYLTPRRPAQITAEECRISGGEFLLYDRADFSAALGVWLPLAEDGDAEAQTVVGVIYERGPAGEPDYEQALEWYRPAAPTSNDATQAVRLAVRAARLGCSSRVSKGYQVFLYSPQPISIGSIEYPRLILGSNSDGLFGSEF